MSLKEVNEEISKITKSAWISTDKFVEMLMEQKGKDIKLQEMGKEPIRVFSVRTAFAEPKIVIKNGLRFQATYGIVRPNPRKIEITATAMMKPIIPRA